MIRNSAHINPNHHSLDVDIKFSLVNQEHCYGGDCASDHLDDRVFDQLSGSDEMMMVWGEPSEMRLFAIGDIEIPADVFSVRSCCPVGIVHVDACQAQNLNDRASRFVFGEHFLKMRFCNILRGILNNFTVHTWIEPSDSLLKAIFTD